MKNKKRLLLSVAVMGFLFTGHVFAQEGHGFGQVIDDKQAAADIAANKAVEVGNKICPVSGDFVKGSKMGDKPLKYEYNGKIYNLCCPMCVKDFKKNPGKYSKIVDAQLKKAATQK